MTNFSEWKCELLRAGNASKIGAAAERKHQDVIAKRLRLAIDKNSLSCEINLTRRPLYELDLLVQQFRVFRGDMPFLDLATHVFVQHWRKEEMVLVTDEGDVACTFQIHRGKQAAKASPKH